MSKPLPLRNSLVRGGVLPMSILLAMPIALAADVSTVPAEGKAQLAGHARALLPPDWQARVSQSDHTLVIFVIPPTAAQAFDMLYEDNTQPDLARKLCPQRDDALWNEIAPATDIAVAPAILGKSASRTSCREMLEHPNS